MEPVMRSYQIGDRFSVLPPMIFSDANRRILNITKSIPLGSDFDDHREKLAQLVAVYDEMRTDHLKEVAWYYGYMLLNMDEIEAAIEVLRAGLEENPNDSSTRHLLGDALRKAGRYEEAQQIFQEDFELFQGAVKGITKGVIEVGIRSDPSRSFDDLFWGEYRRAGGRDHYDLEPGYRHSRNRRVRSFTWSFPTSRKHGRPHEHRSRQDAGNRTPVQTGFDWSSPGSFRDILERSRS